MMIHSSLASRALGAVGTLLPVHLIRLILVATSLAVWPPIGGSEMYTVAKLAVLGASGVLCAWWLIIDVARKATNGAEMLDRGWTPTAFDWLWIAHLACGLVTGWLESPTWSMTASWFLPLLAATLVGCVVARSVRRNPESASMLLDALVLAATLIALVALLECLGVGLPWASSRRPHSTLGNRNFVAADCGAALVLALWRALRRPGAWSFGVVTLLTTIVVVTRCRSVWLGAIVTAALVVPFVGVTMLSRTWRDVTLRPRIIGGALAVAIGILLGGLVPWPGLHWNDSSPLSSTASRLFEHDTGTGRARLEDHLLGFHIWTSSPLLGVGPRGWDDASSAAAHVIRGRHASATSFSVTPNSDFVRVLAEQGAIGLLTLLAALGGLVRRGVRAGGGHSLAGDRIAALLALAVLLVHALLDAPLFRITSTLMIAVLAGVLRARSAHVEADAGASSNSPRVVVPVWAMRGCLAAAGMVLVLGCGARVAATFVLLEGRGSIEARIRACSIYPRLTLAESTTLALARRGACRNADAYGQMAMRWAPHHFGVPWALARCYERERNWEEVQRYEEIVASVEPHARELIAERESRIHQSQDEHGRERRQ